MITPTRNGLTSSTSQLLTNFLLAKEQASCRKQNWTRVRLIIMNQTKTCKRMGRNQ